VVRAIKLRQWVAVPSRRNFDRDIERGKEIEEGKARCPGAEEEGHEYGEVGQKGKAEKTHSETFPTSDNSITARTSAACSGTGNSNWHDRRSINRRMSAFWGKADGARPTSAPPGTETAQVRGRHRLDAKRAVDCAADAATWPGLSCESRHLPVAWNEKGNVGRLRRRDESRVNTIWRACRHSRAS